MAELSRWRYFLSLIRWWGPISVIYGLAGLYAFFSGQFLDDAPRLGEIMPWYAWLLGALTILLGLMFEGGYRLYGTLHQQLAASPYDSVVSELANHRYLIGGEGRDGDELFIELAPMFRQAISESQMFSYLWNEIADYNQRQIDDGAVPMSGEAADAICRSVASSILGDWFTLGLLDSETINPAPGATSSIRDSRHDFPYSVYRLSAQGKEVFQFLKKRL